ncbi:hypothetical protein Back11_62730 [Paenibacillus baekrokdamisoli]|uniref:Uncharacterized protein n=1 Tax=Paenibacillus baekrokdamisoli TaxID=1712516 RepID=A0A3G9JL78_9BACL|nr:hypothetical protein [Paenibacillus baekrokdamisoli]MBB3069498.1 spore coat protein B [Paenibacillus baekrokdamisoli]BBH24928.1 hypothetical protein Back11_62730 [Paenibacillus baekrokdamisoli]
MEDCRNSNRPWGGTLSRKSWCGTEANRVSNANHKSNSMGVSSTMEQHKSSRNDDMNRNNLNNKIGKLVKINRGGPESFDGVIVAVHNDYVVIRTSAGLVYVNASHIKSTTDLPGQKSGGSDSSKHIVAANFVGVLRNLSQHFVQINWGGPEKIEGFIAEVNNQSVLLVVGQEKVIIPLFHIKTVKQTGQYASNGSRGSNSNKSGSNNNKSGGNNNKSGGNKNNNKSGGNKSNNNKSGGNKSNNKSGGNKSNNKSGANKGNNKSGQNGNKKTNGNRNRNASSNKGGRC